MSVANVNVRQILLKRGTTLRSLNYTGPAGEVTIDTDLRTLRIHDGLTPGGNVISSGSGTTITSATVNGSGNLIIALSNTTTINAGHVVGAQGIQGNLGPQGIQGIKGDRGDQGISITLKGNVAAPENLPVSANAGEAYIVNTTGNLWFWNSTLSSWGDIGPIIGPRGDKGDTGAQGIQGNVGPQGPQGVPGTSLAGWSIDTFNNLNPNTDNLQDIGTPTARVRHIYVGPGSVTIGNSVLSESATGKLVVPGLTRATGYHAGEIQDTGDQTHSFTTAPVVIDYTYYSILDGQYSPAGSYVEAEYAVDQLDGEGFIDGISVVSQGSGWDSVSANGAKNNNMWAYTGSAGNPFSPFVNTDWIQIPFAVYPQAADTEYEFSTSGGGDNIASNGETLTINGDTGDIELDGSNGHAHDRGLVWRWGEHFNSGDGINSSIRQEEGGLYITPYNVTDGVARRWQFDGESGVLKLPAGGDIVDSNDRSVLGGSSGSGLVQRTINFPLGEAGDTAGTIALTPWHGVYVCTADYTGPNEPQGYSASASASYDKAQSINGTDMVVQVAMGENSALDTFMQSIQLPMSTGWQLSQGNVTDGYTRNCVADIADGENWKFTWQYVAGQDGTSFSQGDEFQLTYTVPQAKIWEQLDNASMDMLPWGIQNNSQGFDLYTNGTNSDRYAEVWMEENNRVLITADGETNSWQFKAGGTMVFPLVNGQTYIQEQRYGMGNVVAYNDGGWAIGVYDGNNYGTEGMRLSPGIEGAAEVILPANQDAANVALQLNNYAGNVQVNANNHYWNFNSEGNLVLPQTDMTASPQPVSYPGITFTDGTQQVTAYRPDLIQPVTVNVDGGGASVNYEISENFADGGFASTRHGVADPTYDGLHSNVATKTYTLNGGGA
jgi:hypothetical protein